MVYFISRAILRVFFKIFFRLDVRGAGNCPRYGPLIVASNHVSFLDPVVVGLSVSRPLYYMARDSLFKNRIFGRILTAVNAFPLKREGVDLGAMKAAMEKLSDGNAVLIFPEGTRSKDGSIGNPRPGIGFLAASSGASILPCYVKGSIDALPMHAVFPKPRKITVFIGRPLRFDIHGEGKEHYTKIAVNTMVTISILKEASTPTT